MAKGRPKGARNKTTHSVVSNVLAVFDMIGGREAMAEWATANKTEFYKLYARALPLQVTGQNGGVIEISIDRKDARAL